MLLPTGVWVEDKGIVEADTHISGTFTLGDAVTSTIGLFVIEKQWQQCGFVRLLTHKICLLLLNNSLK